ncbi:hypothetical protein [Sodalis sp. dw_96]|uniref:hypothetical protein n=1 Tax=Sodalis sp. dw_96 TaxID=2719794 RepID=UPI001BD22D6A|nr:hypothetical protein [Sodalis sp. dw_96]
MSTTACQVMEGIEYWFCSLWRKMFVGTLRLHECTERELLVWVRYYLSGGITDQFTSEVTRELPNAVWDNDYIDFVTDDVVERTRLVFRGLGVFISTVSIAVTGAEIKKLVKYDGKALLEMFDLPETPYSEARLRCLQNKISNVKRNHSNGIQRGSFLYRSQLINFIEILRIALFISQAKDQLRCKSSKTRLLILEHKYNSNY